ncbi:hypothetical protein LB505_004438 [Fusarium chuoi]|nr:hypothetical protein LB505_004438 [Fusarium chuoi]
MNALYVCYSNTTRLFLLCYLNSSQLISAQHYLSASSTPTWRLGTFSNVRAPSPPFLACFQVFQGSDS